jgi:plasmid maintenance system antidote protein VapI
MNQLDKLKGIHPGIYLADLLKKRHLRPGQFALSIGEYPQTLNAIMKGRRAMNTPLSLKIEKSLDLDEGFLMTLQVFHDIRLVKTKKSQLVKPDLSIFRKGLFWDTDPEKIDWIAQKKAIINRIMERGNEQEKNAIELFYKNSK